MSPLDPPSHCVDCADCPGYDIGVCMTRVGRLYDSAYYTSRVLKKHWLSGSNGDVLWAAAPELCRRMEQALDMHSFIAAASPFAAPWKDEAYEIACAANGRSIGQWHRTRTTTE